MNTHPILSLSLILGLAAAALPAQRTWVVDGAGAPGFDFRTIGEAIRAARSGDQVRVRPGSYVGAVIDKPLSVFGEAGAEIAVDFDHPGMTIDGIRSGQQASLRGFKMVAVSHGLLAGVRNCQGRVVLADLEVPRANTIGFLVVESSRSVTLDRCDTSFPLQVRGSKVLAADCDFRSGAPLATTAIQATDAQVTLVQCRVNTAPAGTGYRNAVTSVRSTIEVRGDATSTIAGGLEILRGNVWIQHPAFDGDPQSRLILDPDVFVVTPQHVGFQSVVRRDQPWLTVAGGRVGQAVDLHLGSKAGEPFAVFVGLPGPALPLSLWGDVWLDLGAFVPVVSGTQHPSGSMDLRRSVPNLPGVVGLALVYQALTGAQALELTNGAAVVLFDR